MNSTVKEVIIFLEKYNYEIVNIKIYKDHTQFKTYNTKDKWCVVNVSHTSKVQDIVFNILQNFEHKGEINV